MEIKEKTIEDQKVAIMNYKGSLNDMEVLIGKLTGWVEVEEIETIGDLFAIFYNNPRTAKENEVVYDVGIPINPELDPDETEEIRIVNIIDIKNKFEVENEDDMITEIQLPVIKMG